MRKPEREVTRRVVEAVAVVAAVADAVLIRFANTGRSQRVQLLLPFSRDPPDSRGHDLDEVGQVKRETDKHLIRVIPRPTVKLKLAAQAMSPLVDVNR